MHVCADLIVQHSKWYANSDVMLVHCVVCVHVKSKENIVALLDDFVVVFLRLVVR